MKLSELISPDLVEVPLRAADKWQALRVLAQVPVRAGRYPASFAATVEQALIVREKSMTTGMEHGIAIPHANVPNMVAQILTALAAQGINIADMLNHSRGEISYTLVDLDAPANDATLARIRKIDGILAARVLPIIES